MPQNHAATAFPPVQAVPPQPNNDRCPFRVPVFDADRKPREHPAWVENRSDSRCRAAEFAGTVRVMLPSESEPVPPIFDQWPPPSGAAWLVGIGGAGMRALAEFLRDLGWTVSGTDSDPDGLNHWAGHLGVTLTDTPPVGTSLIVRSAAISSNHPLLAEQDSVTYPQVLATISRLTPVIAVAGTHGKTTTATMLSVLLGDASRLVGGVGCHDGRSGRFNAASTAPIVIEACEYRGHFLDLRPTAAVLLNMEWDHPDVFPSPGDVAAVFHQFVEQLAPGRPFVIHQSAAEKLSALASVMSRPVTLFSDEPGHGYWARDVAGEDRLSFTLCDGPREIASVGVGNVPQALAVNLVAALASAASLGVSPDDALARFDTWRGVERRFEVIETDTMIAVHDYAHHPTAIRVVVEETCRRWPEAARTIVFEPHQASRLDTFREAFAEALAGADQTFLLPAFAAREQDDDGAAVRALSESMDHPTEMLVDLDHVMPALETLPLQSLKPVVLFLGAGAIGRFADEHRHYARHS